MPDLQEQINRLIWFHSIDFGGGVISPGVKKLEVLRAEADIYFPKSLTGKTVLDIGCWDGFMSFEAHRRGAARVLSTDHFAWNDGPGNREAFELGRAHLAPQIEVMDIDIPDLTPSKVGTFDIVLFLGIFYHLRNPFQALETVSKLVKETIVLETHMDALGIEQPAMIFYPGKELADDPTNWWGPNIACVTAMLRDLEFTNISHVRNPFAHNRGIFHAHRAAVSEMHERDHLTSFSQEITSGISELELKPGETYTLEINVKNTGKQPWFGGKGEATSVTAGYRWVDNKGNGVHGPNRALFNRPVIRPGESDRLRLQLVAPSNPGTYTLWISMVQEGVYWFYARGAKPLFLRVKVG